MSERVAEHVLKDLDELRAFVQVVDSGSMTAASRVLGIPTNSVSRRIARLEGRLGVPLANRTTRSLRPTEEGMRLYAYAIRMLEEASAAEDDLRGGDDALSGELRLASPTLLARLLRPMVVELIRDAPQLAVRLFVSDRPPSAVVGDIVSQGLDAALLVGPLPAASIVARRMCRFDVVLAASVDYLEARGRPRRPSDLRSHDCLCYLGERVQTSWPLLDRRGKEHVVPVRGPLASTDSRALRDAMQDGLGIGPIFAAELEPAGLVRVLPGYHAPSVDLRLGYAPGRRSSRRIAELERRIRAAFVAVGAHPG